MRKNTKIKLIYIRYILPPVLMLLTLLMMLIPSYNFAIDGKLQGRVSAWTLLSNSFDAARNVVFSTETQNVANILFSNIVITLITVFSILFAIVFAASVWCAFIAVKYLSGDVDGVEKNRIIFVTAFPCRTVLCIVQLLFVPLAAFPYFMSPIYKFIWGSRVNMAYLAPDGLLFAILSVLAILVLSIICAPMERKLEADIFKKYKMFEKEDEEELSNENEAENSREDNERDEMIRRILLGDNNEENEENITDSEDVKDD